MSEQSLKDPFTVYYVVGNPRSGSSFVGDWIARDRQIINAGEVWQTFRSKAAVEEPKFDEGKGRWARPEERAKKNASIDADPFWVDVFDEGNSAPYRNLVLTARQRAIGLVDCSKTDRGLYYYKELNCRIVIVHTVRAFTTWALSMQKYAKRHELPETSQMKLLRGYIRSNRRYARLKSIYDYHLVYQECLDKLDQYVDLSNEPIGAENEYLRAEMFGTPGFSRSFERKRATTEMSWKDKLLLSLASVDRT